MTTAPTIGQLRTYQTSFLAFANDLIIPAANQGAVRFGDCMADFQRSRFADLAPALEAVAKGERPEHGKHFWEASKGGSKDSDLAVALLWLITFSNQLLRCQVGAADRDQAAELRKATSDLLRLNRWLGSVVDVQRWQILNTKTESVVEIIAADVAGSHGARPDVLILNELSHVPHREFAENLLDNAGKVPRGLVCIATNAGFLGGWQWEWREMARRSPRWCFHRLDRPAPWLEQADIDEAKIRNSGPRFRRLWFSEWSTGGGDALDEAIIDAAVTMPGPPEIDATARYAAALDLGVKHDHSALVVLGVKPCSGRVFLADAQSWEPGGSTGQVDLATVEAAVIDAHQRWGLWAVRYDPHQAAYMAQRLAKRGIPVREYPFTGPHCDEMARQLLFAFRGRRIDLYRDERLLGDLRSLSIVEKGFGHKLEAPSGEAGHADRAIALGIILPAMLRSAMQAAPRPVGRLAISGVGQVLNSSGQFQSVDHAERVVLQRARQLRGPSVF